MAEKEREMENANNAISLKGCRTAILCTDGVEQSELLEPMAALEAAGAEVVLVSPKERLVQAWQHDEKGKLVFVDLHLEDADPLEFNALFLPGGVMNADKLRTISEAVEFVK